MTATIPPIMITLSYDEATLLQYLLPLAIIDSTGLRDVADSLVATLDAQLSPALAAAHPQTAHLVCPMPPVIRAARALVDSLCLDVRNAYQQAIDGLESTRASRPAPLA